MNNIIAKTLILLIFASLITITGCTARQPVFSKVIEAPTVTTETRLIDENGVVYGVKQVDNKPRVSSMPFTYDVALGNFPDKTSINKFGHNADVAATLETVWSGSNLYPYLTTADQLEILSADTDDVAGGTGARITELFGLDSNYLLIGENVTMNGTSVVTSSLSYLRIYRAIVRSAGASGGNEGVITIRDQDTDTARAIIEIQVNQTLMAIFTVPAGNEGHVTSWYVGAVTNKDTEFQLMIRPFGEVFQVKRHIHLVGASFTNLIEFPEHIPEKSDIEIRAMASGGGGDVSAGFSLWYEGN